MVASSDLILLIAQSLIEEFCEHVPIDKRSINWYKVPGDSVVMAYLGDGSGDGSCLAAVTVGLDKGLMDLKFFDDRVIIEVRITETFDPTSAAYNGASEFRFGYWDPEFPKRPVVIFKNLVRMCDAC